MMKNPIDTNKMFLAIVIPVLSVIILLALVVPPGTVKGKSLSVHILSTEEYNQACDPATPEDEIEYVYIVRYIPADTMREVQVQTHSPEERDALIEWLAKRR